MVNVRTETSGENTWDIGIHPCSEAEHAGLTQKQREEAYGRGYVVIHRRGKTILFRQFYNRGKFAFVKSRFVNKIAEIKPVSVIDLRLKHFDVKSIVARRKSLRAIAVNKIEHR